MLVELELPRSVVWCGTEAWKVLNRSRTVYNNSRRYTYGDGVLNFYV